VRASNGGRDELGRLIEGFNEMLSRIQAQDAELQDARESLERRVAERTRELQEEALERHQARSELIVVMQQAYARVGGVEASANLNELVEDSLRLNAAALHRRGVEPVRDLATLGPLMIDKHKVLQVLVNLLRNASAACEESGRPEKRVTVRTRRRGGPVEISVIDTGVRIAPANLTRIFQHGFTTRATGHGFGLHGAPLAARNLGGSLSAHSDGVGCGATFPLSLPHVPARVHAELRPVG